MNIPKVGESGNERNGSGMLESVIPQLIHSHVLRMEEDKDARQHDMQD
jgi:hypothetical protein